MSRLHTLAAVSAERDRQDRIHGKDSMRHCETNLRLAIVTEEVGEVARAIVECDDANLREELIQVAACCVAWIEALEPEPIPET